MIFSFRTRCANQQYQEGMELATQQRSALLRGEIITSSPTQRFYRQFCLLHRHHTDQIYELSQFSKVNLCIQILKCHIARVGQSYQGNYFLSFCLDSDEIYEGSKNAEMLKMIKTRGTTSGSCASSFGVCCVFQVVLST